MAIKDFTHRYVGLLDQRHMIFYFKNNLQLDGGGVGSFLVGSPT
jgi:hypothetical protein